MTRMNRWIMKSSNECTNEWKKWNVMEWKHNEIEGNNMKWIDVSMNGMNGKNEMNGMAWNDWSNEWMTWKEIQSHDMKCNKM